MIQGIFLQKELHPIDNGTVETDLYPSSHNFLLDQTPVQLVFWTVRVDNEPAVFRQDGSVSALLWFAADTRACCTQTGLWGLGVYSWFP